MGGFDWCPSAGHSRDVKRFACTAQQVKPLRSCRGAASLVLFSQSFVFLPLAGRQVPSPSTDGRVQIKRWRGFDEPRGSCSISAIWGPGWPTAGRSTRLSEKHPGKYKTQGTRSTKLGDAGASKSLIGRGREFSGQEILTAAAKRLTRSHIRRRQATCICGKLEPW